MPVSLYVSIQTITLSMNTGIVYKSKVGILHLLTEPADWFALCHIRYNFSKIYTKRRLNRKTSE